MLFIYRFICNIIIMQVMIFPKSFAFLLIKKERIEKNLISRFAKKQKKDKGNALERENKSSRPCVLCFFCFFSMRCAF
jgi:hypothetical protein